MLGCWVSGVGIVSPEPAPRRLRRCPSLAPPIDDTTSANSLDEVSRGFATRRARCDDGRFGAHRAPSAAPSISWISMDIIDIHDITSIIITAFLHKCTSLRIVSPIPFLWIFSHRSVSRTLASRTPVCEMTRLERRRRTRACRRRCRRSCNPIDDRGARVDESRHTSTGDRGDDGDDRVGEM